MGTSKKSYILYVVITDSHIKEHSQGARFEI